MYSSGYGADLLVPLAAKMSEEPFRLVIMDSVAANLRVDFTGRGRSPHAARQHTPHDSHALQDFLLDIAGVGASLCSERRGASLPVNFDTYVCCILQGSWRRGSRSWAT